MWGSNVNRTPQSCLFVIWFLAGNENKEKQLFAHAKASGSLSVWTVHWSFLLSFPLGDFCITRKGKAGETLLCLIHFSSPIPFALVLLPLHKTDARHHGWQHKHNLLLEKNGKTYTSSCRSTLFSYYIHCGNRGYLTVSYLTLNIESKPRDFKTLNYCAPSTDGPFEIVGFRWNCKKYEKYFPRQSNPNIKFRANQIWYVSMKQ